MNPPLRHWLPWLGLLLCPLLVTSCSRDLRLQVVLGEGEEVTKDTPVFVDAARAGTVVSVGEEAGERVADLVIRDREARGQLRVGAVRVREPGRIQIRTDAVKEGAVVLPHGARIPTTSKAEYLVRKYSRGSTLVFAGVAVVILVILWLVFRSLVGTLGLILCVVLSGVVTQAFHPYAVPWVERGLNALGPPPAAAPVSTPRPVDPSVTDPPPAGRVADPGTKPSSAAGVYQQAEAVIVEVINARPSPQVVTWCGVFVLCFIGFNLVLGRVSRVWRK